MTSIKDYYNANTIYTIDSFTDWEGFIYHYGRMVGNPWSVNVDATHGEYFSILRSSINMYPDFKHSIYTLNVFRHFMERGVGVDKMVEDMLWEIVGNGSHDMREDKFIEELLDILDYLEIKEINVSIEDILTTCAWEACNDVDQTKTFNRFLSLSDERGMNITDHTKYIDLDN